MCGAVTKPSILPDPPLLSPGVWVNVGLGQGPPADELVLTHGTEEDHQQAGVVVVPRVWASQGCCHLPILALHRHLRY